MHIEENEQPRIGCPFDSLRHAVKVLFVVQARLRFHTVP